MNTFQCQNKENNFEFESHFLYKLINYVCLLYIFIIFFHAIQSGWQGHSLPPSAGMLPLSESPILELTEQMESM